MKALVSINFALELDDEDDLTTLAAGIDESMYQAIVKHVHQNSQDWRDFIETAEDDGVIDWYGATISIKRSVVNGVESE